MGGDWKLEAISGNSVMYLYKLIPPPSSHMTRKMVFYVYIHKQPDRGF